MFYATLQKYTMKKHALYLPNYTMLVWQLKKGMTYTEQKQMAIESWEGRKRILCGQAG
jgi:hypothetical protein